MTTTIGGYSRGRKQRLGVAQALVNAPRLLLLDEPTSALDPMGRKDVLDMLSSLRGRTTVFFSTHILADVERVCDTVAILDRGPASLAAGKEAAVAWPVLSALLLTAALIVLAARAFRRKDPWPAHLKFISLGDMPTSANIPWLIGASGRRSREPRG